MWKDCQRIFSRMVILGVHLLLIPKILIFVYFWSKRGLGTSAGSFREQRLVIEPNSVCRSRSQFRYHVIALVLIVVELLQWPFSRYFMLNSGVAVCYFNETNIFNWLSWSRLSEWRFGDRYHTQRRGESYNCFALTALKQPRRQR